MMHPPQPLPVMLPLLIWATPALAFDEADRIAVMARADSYEAAVAGRNYEVFVDALPPKVLASMAEKTGMDSTTLKDAMRVQVSEAMAAVTLDQFDLQTEKMTEGDTKTGRPYALIPTVTTIAQDNAAPDITHTMTLALRDGALWYLVRLDGAQTVAMLRQAYPDFGDVDLGPDLRQEQSPAP